MRRTAGKHSEDQEDIPGGDSFLDIMANIVGILVLLVVVVGVRAGRQVLATAEVAPVAVAEVTEATEQAVQEAVADARETVRLRKQAIYSAGEARLRDQARMEMAEYIATLRKELNTARGKLSESDQRSYDIGNQLAQARLELEDLTRRQISLSVSSSGQETETIFIDPTPIVRERVQDEMMLRIEGEQIVFLPVKALKEEFERSIPILRDALAAQPGEDVTIERRIGPIDGFLLRCVLRRQLVRSREGARMVGGLVVARLEQVGEVHPESLDIATSPGSQIDARLTQVDPNSTVVTLVVYPDSFGMLPELEKRLRDRGYRVAKTLQQAGHPIDFSTGGRTTTLQ